MSFDEEQQDEEAADVADKLFNTLEASHRHSVSVHWQFGPHKQFSQEQLGLLELPWLDIFLSFWDATMTAAKLLDRMTIGCLWGVFRRRT